MTVRNRLRTTQRFLQSLDLACKAIGVVPQRYVVDDGSSDGTWEMLCAARRSGDVFIQGQGDLYWAGGMRRAAQELPKMRSGDLLLLANDDVVLTDCSIKILVTDLEHSQRGSLIVGATTDPLSGAPSYGGYVRGEKLRALSFRPVYAPRSEVDAMNANAVLMRGTTFEELHGLDRSFQHSLADFDLALRAVARGRKVVLSSAPVGECPRNAIGGTWRDPKLPIAARVKMMREPKGLPPLEWARFCLRHAGLVGLPYVVKPWLAILLRRPT